MIESLTNLVNGNVRLHECVVLDDC